MNKQIDIINTIISEAKTYEDFKGVPLENIIKVHITVRDDNIEWLGKIIPSSSNNDIDFELFLQNSVINDLLSNDSSKSLFAKSIILHELYHLKEITFTDKFLNIMPIYNIVKDCTRSMFIYLGYTQWSEYYSHYNSSKYYYSLPELSDCINQSEISLTVLKQTLDNESQVQLSEFMYNNIKSFIAKAIKFSAIYNQSRDDSLLESIKIYKYEKLYLPHYNFILKIIPYMDTLYQTYPNWISEEQFLTIGKELFSIIHDYNMTYSTSDLSDNFIFVSV